MHHFLSLFPAMTLGQDFQLEGVTRLQRAKSKLRLCADADLDRSLAGDTR
jgi:hypothetical protein